MNNAGLALLLPVLVTLAVCYDAGCSGGETAAVLLYEILAIKLGLLAFYGRPSKHHLDK